jgi:hypothetical protein
MPRPTSLPRDQRSLQLNSFVRRSRNTDTLKALIIECGADLSRKGRSRNWRLTISLIQSKILVGQIYQSDEPSWLWLAKLLSELKGSYDQSMLVEIARSSPSISVSELISKTDCSASDARQALDTVEWS